ncbi:hypothetical protein J437_LFUL019707 [Ladona fulva]|uniref:Secreted protein n=1 Tax=Ladona fulva TaxID=123851 RepID=A0A8K0PCU5_LADFU|nr:hypothetical protein J437_LFUL019707 [Ladona fulva]
MMLLFSLCVDIAFLQALKLPAIVTSSLNPLKSCADAIARRFASAVETLQLAYCTTVIEANARDTIPVENGSIVTPSVSLIFPFDRYILTKC